MGVGRGQSEATRTCDFVYRSSEPEKVKFKKCTTACHIKQIKPQSTSGPLIADPLSGTTF